MWCQYFTRITGLVFVMCALMVTAYTQSNKAILFPIPINKEKVNQPITIRSTEFIDDQHPDANKQPLKPEAKAIVNSPSNQNQLIPIAPALPGTVTPDSPGVTATITKKEIVPAPTPTPEPAKPPAPILSPEERKARLELLQKILKQAQKQCNLYNETFRDLSVEETRISELMEGNKTKLKRTVMTELVVYQSRLDELMAYEFRTAKKVDNKALKVDEKRLETLFQKLLSATTTREELDLLNDEGFLHDLLIGGHFYGLTLFQFREIMPWALPDVGFEIAGRDKIDGKEVVVVYFEQLQKNEKLEWKLPSNRGFELAQQRTRGLLYFDVNTFQLRRAERELNLVYTTEKAPVRVWRQELNYKESAYGILVPAKFIAEYYYTFTRAKDGQLRPELSGRLTSTFGEFKRFTVSSEEEKKKTLLKPEQ